MLYNWTINATIAGFLGMTNTITYGIAIPLIVLALGIILFASLVFTWGLIIALISTGSIMFFLSMLLSFGGLVHPLFVFFWMAICGIGVILFFIGR